MKKLVSLIFIICSLLSANAQVPSPELVKSLVTDYYSFADTTEWNNHIAVTHPKLRADSLLWKFVREINMSRLRTGFSKIGINNVMLVADEMPYDNFFISKWKVEGCEEIELTPEQMVNRKASIDNINAQFNKGSINNYKYFSLKEGTENIIESCTNWHVIICRYAAEKNYYVVPYETRTTSPSTGIFPYEGNKLKLALYAFPLDALIQLEHVDGLKCDTITKIPLEKMDAAMLETLKNGNFEELLCRIGINYRTVKDVSDYQKRKTESRFGMIVSMHTGQLQAFQTIQSRCIKEKKHTWSYEGAVYEKKQQSNGEFCSVSMRFKIDDKLKAIDFIFYHSATQWVLVDINGDY